MLCSCAGDGAKSPDAGRAAKPANIPASAPQIAAMRPEQPKVPPYLERHSMIMFPSTLDGLQLGGHEELAKPERGVCVKYGKGQPGSASLDIFASEGGEKDGIDGVEAKQAFNDALLEISTLASKGLYKKLAFGFRRKMELPTADPKRGMEALAAKVSFELDGAGPMDSYLLVSCYNGCLLKLRLSMPKATDADARFENLAKAFGTLLYKSGKTSVDANTKEAVLNAVKALEDDPLASGTLAAPAIMIYAKDSEDVTVSLNPSALPWLEAGERLPHNDLLIAAFIGGNVRRQLLDAKLEDSPVDGLRCVFKAYAKIRESEPSFRSPAIERLIRLDAAGKLQDSLKSESLAAPRKGKAK